MEMQHATSGNAECYPTQNSAWLFCTAIKKELVNKEKDEIIVKTVCLFHVPSPCKITYNAFTHFHYFLLINFEKYIRTTLSRPREQT